VTARSSFSLGAEPLSPRHQTAVAVACLAAATVFNTDPQAFHLSKFFRRSPRR
jgi:hypothetical protein